MDGGDGEVGRKVLEKGTVIYENLKAEEKKSF